MLHCNSCVVLNKREKLVYSATKLQQVALADDERLKTVQKEVNENQKAGSEIKETVIAITRAVENAVNKPVVEQAIIEAPAEKSNRLKGVSECSSRNAWEKQRDYMKEIKQMLAFMNVDCKITELRRLGPQQKKNKKNSLRRFKWLAT